MAEATFRTSNDITEIATALAAAQGEYPPIKKERTANVKSDKGGYEYKYADIGDVLAATLPVLSKHGLALDCGLKC